MSSIVIIDEWGSMFDYDDSNPGSGKKGTLTEYIVNSSPLHVYADPNFCDNFHNYI